MVGLACAMLGVAACAGGKGGSRHDSTRVTASGGDVSQYSLMKDQVGWLTDSNIVALATTVNQGPVRLARIETEQSTDAAVHEFALQVIRDHNALQVSIDSLAERHRIPSQQPAVAGSVRAPYDSAELSITGVPASEFSSRFMSAEQTTHAHTATDFGALGGNATDQDLRALLSTRAIAMEQQHIARANQLAASVARADSSKQSRSRKP